MKSIKLIITLGIISLLIVSLFAGCSSSSTSNSSNNSLPSNSTPTYEDIDGSKLIELIKDSNTVVVDVREPDEYSSGHIDKSILLPLGELPNQLNQLDKNKTILLVCASGARSARAAKFLVENGYNNVKNLQGGVYGNNQLTLVK